MGIFEKLEAAQKSLTKADLALWRYIKEKGLDVCNAPISEIAKSCGVSHATVTRFARKFGYESLQAFKIALAQEIGPSKDLGHLIPVNISYSESSIETASKLSQLVSSTIMQTAQNVDHQSLNKITKFLAGARRVLFIGKGNSGFVALDTAFKFNRIGIDARAITDTHEMLILCSLLTKKDVVVAFSNSGTTPEVIQAISLAKNEHAKVIAITAQESSDLCSLANETLLYTVRETCLDSGSIYSKTAVFFIVDLIFTELCKLLGQSAVDIKHKTGKALVNFCKPTFGKELLESETPALSDTDRDQFQDLSALSDQPLSAKYSLYEIVAYICV